MVQYGVTVLGWVRGLLPKFRLAKLLWPACPAGRNNRVHAKVVPSEISLVREAKYMCGIKLGFSKIKEKPLNRYSRESRT